MAKRKRLTLPGEGPADRSLPEDAAPLFPPIARVAADSAASAALGDLARELAEARDSGRMILSLPLEAVDETYLVRDRVASDEEDLQALMASIRQRGQQVPIEVTALPDGRYGLISGWRRLTALRRLARETDLFSRVLAILRRPEAASDAYLAMVEENELRVGLSYYERARIVLRSTEQGVFPDSQTALARLFASGSRAKRSKIGSFQRIVRALDEVLRFPAHIPERLGLTLSHALDEDPHLALSLQDSLRDQPALTAAEETRRIETLLAPPKPARPAPVALAPQPPIAAEPRPAGTETVPGIFVETGKGFVTFRGARLTADVQMQLIGLLSQLRD